MERTAAGKLAHVRMAKSTSTKKKAGLDALAGADDPRAPLDAAALLDAARKLLARLEVDLRQRAEASPAVARALREQYDREKAAERTAETFAGWTAALATQVAAAWLLSCVFVRTLEDRGLLRQARIAGPGAIDSQRLFFQLAPSLTERDYLLMVWKELAQYPAARGLFDAEHSLVWKLSPSAELARDLLALFRTPTAEAPAFRFGQASTRFLGDLYQDLSEDVRKRYALLQTPDFVETFILDRTLEPAIERFGLDETTVIDPTCGSGHFLLGSFARLFEHRLRREPGVDPRVAAVKAVDAVYGADLNPYAVAIARFRLTLEVLAKAGYRTLADAPALPLHVVVADSLRVNPQHAQPELWQQAAAAGAGQAWVGQAFALEDDAEAREVLFRRYAAVVGNPPYITEKDPAKREVYRKMYVSAAGKYALSAPFCERFFQLCRDRGYCGQITANSFMKREFGKKLIEEYLPTVNLELIVNTSGAYIPGHGTPTVLSVRDPGARVDPRGPRRPRQARRAQHPGQPRRGQGVDERRRPLGRRRLRGRLRVGRAGGAGRPGETSVEPGRRRGQRAEGAAGGARGEAVGGGGRGHRLRVVHRARRRLHPASPCSEAAAWGRRSRVATHARRRVSARLVATTDEVALFTLRQENLEPLPYDAARKLRAIFLWRYRPSRTARELRGENQRKRKGRTGGSGIAAGRSRALAGALSHRLRRGRDAQPLCARSRGQCLQADSADSSSSLADATEDDHYALLAYLNSSTACFWMKQVMMNKGATSDTGVLQADEEKFRYEFDGTKLKQVPIPPDLHRSRIVDLARQMDTLAGLPRANDFVASLASSTSAEQLTESWAAIAAATHDAQRTLVALQEEIDWLVYDAFALVPAAPQEWMSSAAPAPLASEERPFLSDRGLSPVHGRRRELCVSADALRLLETSEYKRRWYRSRGRFDSTAVDSAYVMRLVAEDGTLTVIEQESRMLSAVSRLDGLLDSLLEKNKGLHTALLQSPAADTAIDPAVVIAALVDRESVPFLAACRLNEAGLATWHAWLECWDLQRREDAGESVGAIPVPPKYKPTDFLEARYFRLRGKLDVPKERFISYPGCESDDDGEPVYGWAGWDHLQRAQALANLYMDRKTREGWPRERLLPMLAGLLELIPWVKQWHNEPSAEYDGLRMGDYFAQFLDGELRLHALTTADLRAWRPAKRTRGKAKPTPPRPTPTASAPDSAAPPAPKPKRPRTRKAATDQEGEV
jgi:hypothetical protein